MKKLFLCMALLVGCSTVPPGAERATQIAWKAFGEQGPPPRVEWVGRSFACPSEPRNLCVGTWFPLEDRVVVVTAEKPSETALAHELMHAHFYRLYGLTDHYHSLVDWGVDRYCWEDGADGKQAWRRCDSWIVRGKLDEVNQKLREEGL